MTPMENFYHLMGFLDCLQLYAQSAPNPEQATMKRMYIQEKAIPEILPSTFNPVIKEEVKQRLDELAKTKPVEDYIKKWIAPKVDQYKMEDILKKAQFTKLEDLK